jgi:hypothetical protein
MIDSVILLGGYKTSKVHDGGSPAKAGLSLPLLTHTCMPPIPAPRVWAAHMVRLRVSILGADVLRVPS